MKKVRAIGRGFYMGIREVGEVFHIPADFAAPWFIPEGFNPPEPDNQAVGDRLDDDGLNPNGAGLNPEPQWVEPTPETKPETDNKTRKPNKQEDLK
nr:MAG TPA: hypothetical protein [Caudoviricetes sp.]